MAIGEIMTLTEKDGELFCMEYSAFTKKFTSEDSFREWFSPVENGIAQLVDAKSSHRLRRLRHLMLDLIEILDPQHLGEGREVRNRVGAAAGCQCSRCLTQLDLSRSEAERLSHLQGGCRCGVGGRASLVV